MKYYFDLICLETSAIYTRSYKYNGLLVIAKKIGCFEMQHPTHMNY